MSLTTEQIEEERLKLERARLAFEKRQALYRLLAVLGACATFIWTAFTYFDARKRESEARRLEASRTYLDRQLKLFEEATTITARIAVAGKSAAPEDKRRFWQLYWGELALVEGKKVESAMVRFGNLLQSEADMSQAALDIAHECREELARSWNTEVWSRK
jgi:hypothetical protein